MIAIQACHLRCNNCGAELTCSDKGHFWWGIYLTIYKFYYNLIKYKFYSHFAQECTYFDLLYIFKFFPFSTYFINETIFTKQYN
jgi:hypothetical protein